MSRDIATATWGLFVGLSLLMVAAGLFGTLLGVRSELVRLSTGFSSLISASYYVGFLAGSKFTLDALGRVGHIRVYAALASLLSAAMITVGLVDQPIAWIGLRFVTGVSLAGVYVVAESWLNDLADNDNRGRLLAIYNVIATGAFGLGQFLITAFDARLVSGYALAAILTSLAIGPVSLSEKSAPPVFSDKEHISLRELAKVVPTGIGSCFLVGIAHGALGGMAAIYATRVGLSLRQTSIFVTAPMVGGMLFQWPISAASDDLDRRAVGFAAAVGGFAVAHAAAEAAAAAVARAAHIAAVAAAVAGRGIGGVVGCGRGSGADARAAHIAFEAAVFGGFGPEAGSVGRAAVGATGGFGLGRGFRFRLTSA